MKSLNFNSIKKRYLTVTLADKDQTTVMISTPTKRVLGAISNLQSVMTKAENGNSLSEEALDDIYDICAEIMSHNKSGVKIEKELLEDIFDFEDITIFFNAYMDFINEGIEGKN